MLNVADEMSDISTASSTLISVMKAYNLQASQAGEITDTLNEVSNNAAISFDDLAEGISRSGAVYAQAGTS
ncbi:phage tail tape measure protein, partial [Enterobacter asburiae]